MKKQTPPNRLPNWIFIPWGISLLIVYFVTSRISSREEYHYLSPVRRDTIVAKVWQFHEPGPVFQLYIKHIVELGAYPVSAFLTIHINSNDKSFYIDDCNPNLDLDDAKPEKLFRNIYSYPYATGGNYSRGAGVIVFRVDSIAKLLGPVSGYDKLHKKFYVNYVSEFGESNADNKIDTMHVQFTGDSLIYPFLDGGY